MKSKKPRKTVDRKIKRIKIVPFFETNRLSYSKISTWKSSRAQFVEHYFKGVSGFTSPEIEFGKKFAELLENNDKSVAFVPKYDIAEYKFEVPVEGIPCVGYADSVSSDFTKLLDHKTGKVPWTATRAAQHLQLDMYSLMSEIQHGHAIEDTKIVWIETMNVRPDKTGPLWNKSRDSIALTGKLLEFPRVVSQADRDLMRQIIALTAAQIEEAWKIWRQSNSDIQSIGVPKGRPSEMQGQILLPQ